MLQLLGAGFLGAFSIPLVIIDVRQRRLPNKITLPAIALSLIGVLLSFQWDRLLWSVGTSVVLFAISVFVSVRGWFGMGDAKLLVAMSLTLCWYGVELLCLALAVAFVAAGLVVGARMLLGRVTMSSTIALGPYLLLGFWSALGLQLIFQ